MPAATSHSGKKKERSPRDRVRAVKEIPHEGAQAEQAATNRENEDCVHVRPSLLFRLPDLQAPDLAGRGELKPEIGSKIAPLIRMECADQVEAVVLHTIDRSEALVARASRVNFSRLRGAPFVVEFCAGSKSADQALRSPL